MRVTTVSRIAAALTLFALSSACSDSTGPDLGVGTVSEANGLTITPTGATIRPGEMVRLQAHLANPAGNGFGAISPTWSSSNESVAAVSQDGEVYGRTEGFAVITARAQGKSQIASIRVVAGPQSRKPILYLRPNMEPARRAN